jgi:AcrR family transcriptional regulator
MKQQSIHHNQIPVTDRLIESAMACFLNDDYHKVSTRQIAAKADTNISMIRYYFGNKEGLYEEMIKQTLQPLIDVLDNKMLETDGGFKEYFKL